MPKNQDTDNLPTSNKVLTWSFDNLTLGTRQEEGRCALIISFPLIFSVLSTWDVGQLNVILARTARRQQNWHFIYQEHEEEDRRLLRFGVMGLSLKRLRTHPNKRVVIWRDTCHTWMCLVLICLFGECWVPFIPFQRQAKIASLTHGEKVSCFLIFIWRDNWNHKGFILDFKQRSVFLCPGCRQSQQVCGKQAESARRTELKVPTENSTNILFFYALQCDAVMFLLFLDQCSRFAAQCFLTLTCKIIHLEIDNFCPFFFAWKVKLGQIRQRGSVNASFQDLVQILHLI